jgi:hypothetical protein
MDGFLVTLCPFAKSMAQLLVPLRIEKARV